MAGYTPYRRRTYGTLTRHKFLCPVHMVHSLTGAPPGSGSGLAGSVAVRPSVGLVRPPYSRSGGVAGGFTTGSGRDFSVAPVATSVRKMYDAPSSTPRK